jgi:hypothetical protein
VDEALASDSYVPTLFVHHPMSTLSHHLPCKRDIRRVTYYVLLYHFVVVVSMPVCLGALHFVMVILFCMASESKPLKVMKWFTVIQTT